MILKLNCLQSVEESNDLCSYNKVNYTGGYDGVFTVILGDRIWVVKRVNRSYQTHRL